MFRVDDSGIEKVKTYKDIRIGSNGGPRIKYNLQPGKARVTSKAVGHFPATKPNEEGVPCKMHRF